MKKIEGVKVPNGNLVPLSKLTIIRVFEDEDENLIRREDTEQISMWEDDNGRCHKSLTTAIESDYYSTLRCMTSRIGTLLKGQSEEEFSLKNAFTQKIKTEIGVLFELMNALEEFPHSYHQALLYEEFMKEKEL